MMTRSEFRAYQRGVQSMAHMRADPAQLAKLLELREAQATSFDSVSPKQLYDAELSGKNDVLGLVEDGLTAGQVVEAMRGHIPEGVQG
jgi:hypothetical protein